MNLLLALLPLVLAAPAVAEDGGAVPMAVTVDGGEVPAVIPKLTSTVAAALAPELLSDGGQLPDGGGQSPVIAPASLSVFAVDLPAEAAVTAGSFGLYFMVDILIKPTLEGDISCRRMIGNGRCNPADLSAFDRYAVGRTSQEWRLFSDVALATSMVVPVLYLALESLALPTQTPWSDFAKDALVITESLALTASIQTVLKFAFRRPRPTRYLDTGALSSFDEELSLPSGHTSLVAAATTALTTTVFMRHPESKVRYIVLGAGIVLSALTGFARVESGQHFPTDAITGLLIGGFAGFAVPYLHRKKSPIVPSMAFNPINGMTMFAVTGSL